MSLSNGVTPAGSGCRPAASAVPASQSGTPNAALREALTYATETLYRISSAPAWGAPDRWETTPAEVRWLARDTLTQIDVALGLKPAKAIEAQSDKTACGLGPKGESAVPKGFAHD